MAEETKTTRTVTEVEDRGSSDVVRKVVAAVVGIIIIILLVFLAKWLGDRVRERFFPAKTPTKVTQVIPPENNSDTNDNSNTTTNSNNPNTPPYNPANDPTMVYNPQTGTYVKKVNSSATLPATGPNDLNYLLLGSLAIFGLGSLALAKKYSL